MAIAAGIGAIIGAGASVVSAVGASKARKRQRRLQETQAARSRQQQLREMNLRRAQVTQAGINTGADLGSSGVIGGTQNVAQQARSNVGFINQVQQLQNRIASARGLISLAQGIGAIGGAITSVGSSGVLAPGAGKQVPVGAVPNVTPGMAS